MEWGKIDWDQNEKKEAEQKSLEPEKKVRTRNSDCIKRHNKNIYRRAFSETQLMDAVGLDFKDGESYHCITAGDVDSLSYLKLVLRQQDLDYCLFSTWCMAADDVLQFEEWLEDGRIKKLDAYVGEIFPTSYMNEYHKLTELFEKHKCGTIKVFRNHSKIYAGFGKKFYFGIETSANINTNPRTENGCITIAKDLYQFYRDYFEGITGFNID